MSEEALEKTLEKNTAEKPEAKKRSWKKPVLAGIVTVAFIAAIVSVVLFGMGRGSKESVKRKPDKDILLPVFQDEKWGYKNIHNEWVIQPQFEYADLFTKKGVALARMNEETCLIDKKGKIIANIHLDNSEDGIYAIYDYEYDSDAVNIEDFSLGGLLPVRGYTFASDDTAAFIDEKGNIIGETYEEISAGRSEKMKQKGYYLVREEEKAGYVNGKNETVIPLVYDDLGNMGKNGLIRAEVNGRWGWINEKNETVIPFLYEETGAFHYGLAKVFQNGRAGFVDEQGNMAIPCVYDNAGRFGKNGLAPVRQGDKWGYINKRGELAIPAQYDMAYSSGEEEIARVELNDRYSYINKENNVIIPPIYDWLSDIGENGLLLAVSGEKYGYVDRKGQTVIPLEYDWDSWTFGGRWSDGLLAAVKDGVGSCLNEKNEVLLQMGYDMIVSYGVLGVEEHGTYSILKAQTGETVRDDLKGLDTINVYKDKGVQYFLGFDGDGRCVFWFDLEGNLLAETDGKSASALNDTKEGAEIEAQASEQSTAGSEANEAVGELSSEEIEGIYDDFICNTLYEEYGYISVNPFERELAYLHEFEDGPIMAMWYKEPLRDGEKGVANTHLEDLNGDGIPELTVTILADSGEVHIDGEGNEIPADAWMELHVYMIVDGEVEELEQEGAQGRYPEFTCDYRGTWECFSVESEGEKYVVVLSLFMNGRFGVEYDCRAYVFQAGKGSFDCLYSRKVTDDGLVDLDEIPLEERAFGYILGNPEVTEGYIWQLSEEMEEYGDFSDALSESFEALLSGEYTGTISLLESADAISSMSLGYGEDDTVEYGWSILLG